MAYVFPKTVILHRSSVNDYLYFYADLLFQGVFMGVLFSSVSFAVSYFTETSLNDWLPVFKGRLQDVYGVALLWTLFLAATADFALFFSHFLQHRIPWLWEFHKVHHSAEVMTPITVFRMHPVDNILAFSMGGLLSGLALGCAAFLMGHNVTFYNVAGVNVILIFFYLLGYNLRHSHIWWSWGPFSAGFLSVRPSIRFIIVPRLSISIKIWALPSLFGTVCLALYMYLKKRKPLFLVWVPKRMKSFLPSGVYI